MLRIDDLAWAEATEELPVGHALGEPQVLFAKLDAAELFADRSSD